MLLLSLLTIKKKRRKMNSVLLALNRIPILILLIALTFIGCYDVNADELVLKLSTNDSTPRSDSIRVKIVFENFSNDNIVIYNWKGGGGTIKGAMGAFLNFNIFGSTNSDTLIFDHIGPIPKRPHEKDTVVIKANDIYEETIVLNSHYLNRSIVDSNAKNKESNRNWLTGDYLIQCTYEYEHNPDWIGGRTLWRGKILSNVISVQVK